MVRNRFVIIIVIIGGFSGSLVLISNEIISDLLKMPEGNWDVKIKS